MLCAGPQLISRNGDSGLPVPAGAVVAWSGTVASVPAGWRLCDGTNGTPNLSGKFVRATSDTIALGATGDGSVTGTTSTSGAHTGSNNAGGSNTGSGASYGNTSSTSNGSHAHTLSGTLDLPVHYTLAYIKATVQATLPAGAIVWKRDAAIPANCSRYGNLNGKFAKGVIDNTRASAGLTTRAWALSTSTAGAHTHGPSFGNSAGTTTNYSATTQGAHSHGQIASGSTTDKPPYLALVPILINADSRAARKLVLAYDGDLGTLPTGWRRFTEMAGMFPAGADEVNGLAVLATGGTSITTPLSGSITAYTLSHSHEACCSGSTERVSPHGTYAWSHTHTWTGTLDPMVPYYALHHITRD